jgi:hypothetical protein
VLAHRRRPSTDGPDFRAGTSVDQLVAAQIGQDAIFPSLEVATEDFTGLQGTCDPGYSCAYMNTLNWQSPTSPLPMEINPRVVFERLFGRGATPEARLKRMRTDRSILDFVTEDLSSRAGARRGDEFIGDVREIERRIQQAEARASTQPDVPAEPVGCPGPRGARRSCSICWRSRTRRISRASSRSCWRAR